MNAADLYVEILNALVCAPWLDVLCNVIGLEMIRLQLFVLSNTLSVPGSLFRIWIITRPWTISP